MKQIIIIGLLLMAVFLMGCQPEVTPIEPPEGAQVEPTQPEEPDTELEPVENIISEDCKVYYDGCNACTRGENGLDACTMRYCEVMEEARCLDDEVSQEPAENPEEPVESAILEGCKSYFDGCNNCMVNEDGLAACTRKYCEVLEEPRCLDEE